MADESIISVIRRYLVAVEERGIRPSFGVLFGSFATGQEHRWSDIDLVVVARHFDTIYPHKDLSLLWRVAGKVDSRIEPIPCGERQWLEDDETPIIEIARREGVVVRLMERTETAL